VDAAVRRRRSAAAGRAPRRCRKAAALAKSAAAETAAAAEAPAAEAAAAASAAEAAAETAAPGTRAAREPAAAECRVGDKLTVAVLLRERIPQARHSERAPEQLAEQRGDQRAVHELRRHGVVAVLLEALPHLLELRGAVAMRVVQRAQTSHFFLEPRQLGADGCELVDRRIVLRALRERGALAQRLHLLAAERLREKLGAAPRVLVHARRELAALLHQRGDLGLALLDRFVDRRERGLGFGEVGLPFGHARRLGGLELHRAHRGNVVVRELAHPLRVLVEARRQLAQHPVVAAQRLVMRHASHPAVEQAREAERAVLRGAVAARPEIGEQWIGLVRLALLDTVGVRGFRFLLAHVGHLVRRLRGREPGAVIRVLFEVRLRVGLGRVHGLLGRFHYRVLRRAILLELGELVLRRGEIVAHGHLRLGALREHLLHLARRFVELARELRALDLAQPEAREHRVHAELGLPQALELTALALEPRAHGVELAAGVAEHAFDHCENVAAASHLSHHFKIAPPFVCTEYCGSSSPRRFTPTTSF
jgi:hypothetical protein